jgi:hypothetical protein
MSEGKSALGPLIAMGAIFGALALVGTAARAKDDWPARVQAALASEDVDLVDAAHSEALARGDDIASERLFTHLEILRMRGRLEG